MKWETIKARVAADVQAALMRGGAGAWFPTGDVLAAVLCDSMAERRPWRESLDALADLMRQRIERWDVRMVGKLRELFPQSFPASLRTGPLVADYDEAGEWAVFRADR